MTYSRRPTQHHGVLTETNSEGMHCHACGRTHGDWEDAGSHTVNDGTHAGIIERWRCSYCDSVTEVGRR